MANSPRFRTSPSFRDAPLAQARNPYSRSWLWIPGSRSARPGMTTVRVGKAKRAHHLGTMTSRWARREGAFASPYVFFHSLVRSAISALAGSRIAEGVREKRGAGAGWVTPWRVTKILRAPLGG